MNEYTHIYNIYRVHMYKNTKYNWLSLGNFGILTNLVIYIGKSKKPKIKYLKIQQQIILLHTLNTKNTKSTLIEITQFKLNTHRQLTNKCCGTLVISQIAAGSTWCSAAHCIGGVSVAVAVTTGFTSGQH